MAQERRMAHIHGINGRGELLTIAVYRKDGVTRLSYLAESRNVKSDQDTVAGWREEAAQTWGLRRTITIAASSIGSDSEREEVEDLKFSGRRLYTRSRFRT
jgi:hypothetical protein